MLANRRPSRIDVSIVLFAVPAVLMAIGLSEGHGRAWALAVMPACVGAVLLRSRPYAAAAVIAITSMALRLAYLGIGYSTQVDHARTAAAHALTGASPYGVLLPSATAPPEPFTNGPLALLWWQPGVIVEFTAAMAVLALLVWTRSWLTLALYAGLPFSVYLTTTGVNDYSPGLLIAIALLLAQRRPLLGAGVLAAAAAIKPYAFAWFLPLIGYAGSAAAGILVAASAVLWSPLLVWGPASFLRSVQLHADVHPDQANALNLPALRWLAIPVAAVGLFARRWDHMVLLGSAAFVVYLFLDRWASLGYWLAVLPIAGIAIERRLFRSGSDTCAVDERASRSSSSRTAAAP